MKMCVFFGLALVATLLGSSGRSNAEAPKPLDAPAPLTVQRQQARQQQVNGQAELSGELLPLQQASQTRRIATVFPYTGACPYAGAEARVLRPDPYAGCKIRIIKPDPNVDYKIVQVRPDPNVDYKIRNAYPGGGRVCVVPRKDGRKTIIIRPKPGERGK